MMAVSFSEQTDWFFRSLTSGGQDASGVESALRSFIQQLTPYADGQGKRRRDAALLEALQTLQKITEGQLPPDAVCALVRLLLWLQRSAGNSSAARRRLQQMLQVLMRRNRTEVVQEVGGALRAILRPQQVFSSEDLQMVGMVMEDSTVGREVLRENCLLLLSKLAALVPVVSCDEALCQQTVKVCLQVFQWLPETVSPLVFCRETASPCVRDLLDFLMSVISGKVSSRDTRLLAGTAVAMLVNTCGDGDGAAAAAWSLLQVTHTAAWRLSVGQLQVECAPRGPDGLDRLAVCRGLLTGCRSDVLLSLHPDTQTRLLDDLLSIISGLCEEKLDCHYYVFQVFRLWLKRVKESERRDVQLQRRLMELVWSSAESPMDGVAEEAREAFGLLFEIYQEENDQKSLYVEVLQRISELPWESKAKYLALTAMLPYVRTEQVLQQYPALPSHLLRCLSTNRLSPPASEVYRCLLQKQKRELAQDAAAGSSEADQARRWAQRWLAVVLQALTSPQSQLRTNASSYLLPATLQTFPSAFHALLSAVDPAAPGHLHAWARVMSVQRSRSRCSPLETDDPRVQRTLRLCLCSRDESVRLAALNVLCCSVRSADPPLFLEYAELTRFIPLNLGSESSLFRHNLQASLKKFLGRIRDSCLSGLKRCDTRNGVTEQLERGVAFVDWLVRLCLVSLSPDCSYQRKRSALLLLSVVMETCSDSWSTERKKGQPPAAVSALISWAEERGKWDFFTKSKMLVLIGCLEDSTNEVRELAAEILVKFFPPSLPDDVTAVLRGRAERLLRSPRVQHAQTAALLFQLLLLKAGGATERGEKSSAGLIVMFLLKELEQHFLQARGNMMLAARSSPIHGVVSALHRGLPEVLQELEQMAARRLLCLVEDITRLLLDTLSGDAEETEVAPSFCEMGKAIESVIDEDGEERVLLSEEHSLVLTCCWVSLKEIGMFLGALVERVLSAQHQDVSFTVEELRGASKLFKDIILRCRHWGAVEGCSVGFTRFCRSLLNSSDPDLRKIPAILLQQGLCALQSRSTSVTRRAAGLPMLILGVLSAEDSGKSRPLLAHAVSSLTRAAGAALPHDWDQTLDLPQVCAVHALQALVKGSSLSVCVLQHTPVMAVLSLSLLSSPCWAMRNAALQLYSSLCVRMLGPLPAGDEGLMSTAAFFGLYPTLQPFLLETLERAARDAQDARLHPSLYPVLTLLAKLQPGAKEHTRGLSDFLPPVFSLASCPVYAVRLMASRVLVALVPASGCLDVVLRLVEELPECPAACSCHNRTHGQLLQIRAVLARNTAPSSLLGEVVKHLEDKLWLASSGQRCPLVRLAYVEVVRLVRGSCSDSFVARLSALLLQEIQRRPDALEVGTAALWDAAVAFLCQEAEEASPLWRCLASGSAAVRLAVVRCVAETRMRRPFVTALLQANLKAALLDADAEYRGDFLRALVEVLRPESLTELQEEFPEARECVELLLADLESDGGGSLPISTALTAVGLLLCRSADSFLLWRWCELLEKHRRPDAPEAFRSACAQALGLCGAALLDHNHKHLSVRLISTCVWLLQDDSPRVRAAAAVFPAHLSRPAQGNQALQVVLEVLVEEFWETRGSLEALVSHLPHCDLGAAMTAAAGERLYERDQGSVFTEPFLLSYVLRLVSRVPESPALAADVSRWARDNAAAVQENVARCLELPLGDTLTADWLTLLLNPRFHQAVVGLFCRALVLIRACRHCDLAQLLVDPARLSADLQDLYRRFLLHGVFLPQVFTDVEEGV